MTGERRPLPVRLSRFGKNLFAVAAGILLVLATEVVLSVVGVGRLADDDPFVGFAGSSPLFVPTPAGDGTDYHLNPSKARYFNPRTFRVPKPDGTVRIISFGGSTTYGRPYIDQTSFPAWLGKLLAFHDPDRTYESINAGGISYASYRVVRLMGELSRFQPDLYVVYSGHNEFLEARTFKDLRDEPPALRATRAALHRSRIYSLLYRGIFPLVQPNGSRQRTILGEEVAATLEQIGGPNLYHRDPAFRKGVIRQYRYNLERMVRLCREKGIPLVLCTTPSNLSGISPFKSEHRPGLTPEQRQAWERRYGEGRSFLETGQPGRALASLSQAEEIDDRYALLHFLKGKALQQLGRHEEAYRAYVRAKEEDIVPLRSLEAFNKAVRAVAQAEGVVLADVAARFEAESPDGIPGTALFVDHVHPTLKGQQLIAWVVATAVADARLAPVTPDAWRAGKAGAMRMLSAGYDRISARYRSMGLWGVGRLFHWAGKYPEAYDALRRAWQDVKDVGEIPYLLGELELRRGRPAKALRFYREAERIGYPEAACLEGTAKAHLARGNGRLALDALGRLDWTTPSGTMLALRGEAELFLGDLAAAAEDLESAVRANPGVPQFAYSLARVRVLLGDEQAARSAFGDFLRLSGEPWSERDYAAFRAATLAREPLPAGKGG